LVTGKPKQREVQNTVTTDSETGKPKRRESKLLVTSEPNRGKCKYTRLLVSPPE
jgi:hypothetical protein